MLCAEGRFGLKVWCACPPSTPAWIGFAATNPELCPTAQRMTALYVLIGN